MLKSPEMTGEWEEKLKKIERNEIKATDFMDNIAEYTRNLIKTSSVNRVDISRWGSCPLCGKEIIRGKRAYGCSGWKEGCPYILEPTYKEQQLTPAQIKLLLQLHILPQPIQIKEESRLLVLSHLGQPMDINIPADKQKK
jgi:DNA topoisomerase-3